MTTPNAFTEPRPPRAPRWPGDSRSLPTNNGRHMQASAIDYINNVIEKFPFRIFIIRTDRSHEFQAFFHWHVADQGMEHVYIKPRTPQLNGKVERSHRTDEPRPSP
jgi:transposase InsO family protein